MVFVGSLVAVLVALVVLAALLAASLRPVRRLSTLAFVVSTDLGDRVGMLRARVAALGIRRQQSRTARAGTAVRPADRDAA